jgi:hypothetical protein
MEKDEGAEKGAENYKYLVVLLGLATTVLAAASVYMMEVLALRYGALAGASSIATSGIFNQSVTANLTTVLTQAAYTMTSLHNSMREVYVIFLISLGMLGASFVLYTSRSVRFGSASRRYTLMHSTLTVIYVALFFIVFSSNYQIDFDRVYFMLVYFAMGLALAIDAYLEFVVHGNRPKQARRKGAVRIEPGTPYTNLINLREGVFSRLNGDVRVVDKHFNSMAISNMHRLFEGNLQGIKRIDVLTSKEMFDSKFLDNYNDFKKELGNAGVELNFMLMDDADSATQHERFIFDDAVAYKIPPLNIINKKSEHIVNFNVRDAKSRFEALSKGAIKYENYLVKQAREPRPQGEG